MSEADQVKVTYQSLPTELVFWLNIVLAQEQVLEVDLWLTPDYRAPIINNRWKIHAVNYRRSVNIWSGWDTESVPEVLGRLTWHRWIPVLCGLEQFPNNWATVYISFKPEGSVRCWHAECDSCWTRGDYQFDWRTGRKTRLPKAELTPHVLE